MELSANAITVLERRYLLKDSSGKLLETPDQMFRRVAHHVAQAESPEHRQRAEESFYNLMSKLLFLPNSPTLMNAGKNDMCLSGCFVVPIDDSMISIMDGAKLTAIIHKSGGGTGFSFSNLRPEGDVVGTTGGVASGPISFMRIYDTVTEVVKQGGSRRGANMAILRIDHPDILKFIKCKDDGVSFSNFNISVALTDLFMEAVQNDSIFDLINPKTKQVVQSISAVSLFNSIVEHAWKTGDPGIIFIDRINKYNPVPELGTIESTNPCVTGDTPVLTDHGYFAIESLCNKSVNIWNGQEFSEVIPLITGYNEQVLNIQFSDGSEIKCTPYHTFYTISGKKIAKDLSIGDKLEKFNLPVIQGYEDIVYNIAYTMGLFCGDGSKESTRDRDSIWLYGDKKQLIQYIPYEYVNECSNDRLFVKLPKGNWDKEFVPPCSWNIQSRLAWLAGLLDTDAGKVDTGISIWSINKDFLTRVKMILVTLGVGSTLSIGKNATKKNMPDGNGGKKEYNCQPCYRLTISGFSLTKLKELGLQTHRIDISKTPNISKPRFIAVTNISTIGIVDKVFCFTENKIHRGMFGCVTTGQCGEQPLLPYESCNLGSLNLSRLISNNKININALDEIIPIAVRFLDDVIDTNHFPDPRISEITLKTRKIGLGIMGWADALIQTRIPYASNDAISLAKYVMEHINNRAEQASVELGKEKGPYPAWKITHNINAPRNACRTTIAPTGTLSIIANCSSGIEPIFALAYTRNVLSGTKLEEFNPYFDPEGISVKAILENNGSIKGLGHSEEKSGILQVAHEIPYIWHIRMQAAFQKYTDNAVSKTINMISSASTDDICQAYKQAYELGCKGITIYRDGSKANQVLSTKSTPELTKATGPRKRPTRVEGFTDKIITGCGNMYVTVNVDDNGPCEVFVHLGKSGACACAQLEAICRMISLALRSGVDLDNVVEQLRGIRCPSVHWDGDHAVLSCGDAIAKVLTKELPENEVKKVEAEISKGNIAGQCAECSSTLVYAEGCYLCRSCGFTKCG